MPNLDEFSDEAAFMAQLESWRFRWESVAKTTRTIELVQLATEVLIKDGIQKFSMRRVAEAAGMTLTSLQYHFPKLSNLTNAMIDHRIDNYVDSAKQYLQGLAINPIGAFRAHIAFYLDDAMSSETAIFTHQFQAMACHDPYASKALDAYMKLYRDSLGLFIRRINPTVPSDEAVRRGAAIAAMIDGMMVILSEGRGRHPELQGMKATLMDAAFQIAWAPSRVTGEGDVSRLAAGVPRSAPDEQG